MRIHTQYYSSFTDEDLGDEEHSLPYSPYCTPLRSLVSCVNGLFSFLRLSFVMCILAISYPPLK